MGKRWLIGFSNEDDFSIYCKMISEMFCPYLKPSEKKQVLYATKYTITGETLEDVQENIFYYAIMHTERLRQYRRGQSEKSKRLLVCENVIFDIPGEFNDQAEYLMGWAHWLLKTLYTKVGVMIGKFWTYEHIVSRKGIDIPPPPCHFLSIRSAIKSSDPYFFEGDEHLLQELINSIDNNQDVHEFLLPAGCNIHSFSSMKEHRYYQIVNNWAEKQLER